MGFIYAALSRKLNRTVFVVRARGDPA